MESKSLPVSHIRKGKSNSGRGKIHLASPGSKSVMDPRGIGPSKIPSKAQNNIDPYEIARTMDMPTEAKLFSEAQMIWQRMIEEIHYPLELAQERIEGEVKLQFQLRADGTVEKFHSISGENIFLNTYVASNFIQAFSHPLPRRVKNKIYAARFIFKIIFSETDREKTSVPIFKNILSLERRRLLDPKIIEDMKYIVDRVPVKPTPAGPIVDFMALYQLYKDQAEPTQEWIRHERTIMNFEKWSADVERFQSESG